MFLKLDKPTVQLLMLTKHSLICIICARPLPQRIEWWRNRQKERDDHIHQTNINQSCIVQQFTLSSVYAFINQILTNFSYVLFFRKKILNKQLFVKQKMSME